MTPEGSIRTVAPMTTYDTTAEPDIDEQATEAFAGRLFEVFTGAVLSDLIDIGQRTGLFDAATAGAATSTELAARAGLTERYVREWLAAMATARVFEYDAVSRRFWLPREHAACLTGTGVGNLAPVARLTTMLGNHVTAVADAFRRGGGVPYDAFVPEIHEVMDALWQPMYETLLVPAILPLASGLTERLTAGIRVADVACGTGNGLLVLAREFPASRFVGYDLDGRAIESARGRAEQRGLRNVSFERLDAAELVVDEPFDAILVFNAIHDQADPAQVVRRIHDALAPGGQFLMDEPCASSNLEDAIGSPLAPFTYAVSTLHCMTVSLASGGAGLGTAWAQDVATQMLRDAGFGTVEVHDAPGDPGNAVFVTTKPTSTGQEA